MQELVKLKHFGKPQGLILSIGTINMKYDNPDVALDKTLNLIREFKHAYPDTKLILTTLPPLGVLGLKPSVEQVRADIDEYNSRLLALNGDIDVIKVGFNENMLLRDGIHLNSSGTKELTRAIDDYLKKWV
ncbi:unnamed protein product [Didymodactylos carnosus]|uniref:Uncharacterized protein n=1 Tax=Didymodactylos carnosus TaxID=1234261 RepID=A0A8S2ZFT5_9BILA|nr:unnamed protein product [Didymodactylos carnosus]